MITRERATGSSGGIDFAGFSYSYPGAESAALSQLSLSIEPGQFVLVCGESGSGKSTFLRAVSGLVPHHFGGRAEGEATISGHDLRDARAADLAAVCGSLFQDPETQRVMDSVRAELAFPLENLGREPGEIALAVAEVAQLLGIERLLDRRTDELSGGELQRVVMGAALVTRPAVLVLDEPTSQLDPVAADDLLATLQRLARDQGTTILLADHRVERALAHVDRVLCFEQGVVAVDADPAGYLAALRDQGVGRPAALPPVAAVFAGAGLDATPLDVRSGRRELARLGIAPLRAPDEAAQERPREEDEPALALCGVSYRYPRALATALEGVELELFPGQRAVLLGGNGAGKSTLLQVAKGLRSPLSGSVESAGEVALLLQNPNDYLIHERVLDEAPLESLARFGVADLAERDPRDLSGGQRQRVALAIVMQQRPSVLLLDEPSRGMAAGDKQALAALLGEVAAAGTAVLVATHDVEFAARFAQRAVLLENGRVLADAPAGELLGGGWHFATATARLLAGQGALTPEAGARLLRAALDAGSP